MKSSFAFIGIVSLAAAVSCGLEHHRHHQQDVKEIREEVEKTKAEISKATADMNDITTTLNEVNSLASELGTIEEMEDISRVAEQKEREALRVAEQKDREALDENNMKMMYSLLRDILKDIPNEQMTAEMKNAVIEQTMNNVGGLMHKVRDLPVNERWQIVMSHIQKMVAEKLDPQLAADLDIWMKRPENKNEFEKMMPDHETFKEMAEMLEKAGFTKKKLKQMAEGTPAQLEKGFQTMIDTLAHGSKQSKLLAKELHKMFAASREVMKQEAAFKSHSHHQSPHTSPLRSAQRSTQRPARGSPSKIQTDRFQDRSHSPHSRNVYDQDRSHSPHSRNVYDQRSPYGNSRRRYSDSSYSPYFSGHPTHGRHQPLAQVAY